MAYVLLDCPKCGARWIALFRWKSSRCPRCGYRVAIKPGKFRVFKSREEASRYLIPHR